MKIGVIGLGYVGLPLALELSNYYTTIGFDINKNRVLELNKFEDSTQEVELLQLKSNIEKGKLHITTKNSDLQSCTTYIVTVPTPIDNNYNPNLKPLISASSTVAKNLKKGDIVVYESTVYPGLTEEICLPILEESGLKLNKDFSLGYSPERINPGDKVHTLKTIKKVISASNEKALKEIETMYNKIVTAGTFRAASIKVAEAAKVIENSQRDINIAFVNELAIIFEKLSIDTNDVLEAAATKWNFLPFKPGLVGGHCIGVDPYYLAQKASMEGYIPEIILAGRRLNNGVGSFIANKALKLMLRKGIDASRARAIIYGITFKENCPDIRNTRVIDIYNELRDFGIEVDVVDPNANAFEVKSEFNINLKPLANVDSSNYELMILAVNHNKFHNLNLKTSNNQVLIDVKGMLDKSISDYRL